MPDDLNNGKAIDPGAASSGGLNGQGPGQINNGKGSPTAAPPNPRRIPSALKLPPPGGPGGSAKGDAGKSKADRGTDKDEANREASRKTFESALADILSSTSDEWAQNRYDYLRPYIGDDMAKQVSSKLILSPVERKAFAQIGSRLWEKYVSAEFEYTDEMMGAALVVAYYVRNREGSRLEKNYAARTAAPERSDVQRAKDAHPGDNGNGQVNPGPPPNRS